MDSPNLWAKWAEILWLIILGGLTAYELWCVFSGNAETPPLTRLVVRFSPWWVTMPFLGWLFWHFAVRYCDAEYVFNLRRK